MFHVSHQINIYYIVCMSESLAYCCLLNAPLPVRLQPIHKHTQTQTQTQNTIQRKRKKTRICMYEVCSSRVHLSVHHLVEHSTFHTDCGPCGCCEAVCREVGGAKLWWDLVQNMEGPVTDQFRCALCQKVCTRTYMRVDTCICMCICVSYKYIHTYMHRHVFVCICCMSACMNAHFHVCKAIV
jgi:hypothetical protein